MTETYELAVIGAGPAGAEAAIIASQAGVKTVVIDSFPQPGGQYFKAMPKPFSVAERNHAEQEGDALAERLAASPATKLYETQVWGIFDDEEKGEDWLLTLYGVNAPQEIRVKNIILANGAYENPVAFPGWTLPGVLNTGATLILLKTQRVAPGKRAIVTGTGPLLMSAAAHLIAAGVEVVAVCENSRPFPRGIKYAFTMLGQWGRLMEGVKYFSTMWKAGTPYKTGWSVIEAHGEDHVQQAVMARLDKNGFPIAGSEKSVDVDTIVCGFGLSPNTDLAQLLGCKLVYKRQKGGWVPVRDEELQTSVKGVYVAGDGGGIGGAENSRLEGQVAGIAAARNTGYMSGEEADKLLRQLKPALAQQKRFGRLLGDLFTIKPGLSALSKDDTIVCRCEEITKKDILAAIDAGCDSVGWVKRQTRSGMGMCQGRSCSRQIAQMIAHRTGQSMDSIVPDTKRQPERPIPIEALLVKTE